MLYNGINIDVNAEQHKVIVDFLNSQDNQGFETFINAFNHWKEHGVLDSEVFK